VAEVIQSSRYGTAADVYSYGVLLWELFHRRIPHGDLDPAVIAVRVVEQQLR